MRSEERSHLQNTKCRVKQHVLMEKLPQVPQKTQLREFIKVVTLNSRFSCRQISLLLEGDAIADFHSWKEVKGWLQSFKGEADSLVRG